MNVSTLDWHCSTSTPGSVSSPSPRTTSPRSAPNDDTRPTGSTRSPASTSTPRTPPPTQHPPRGPQAPGRQGGGRGVRRERSRAGTFTTLPQGPDLRRQPGPVPPPGRSVARDRLLDGHETLETELGKALVDQVRDVSVLTEQLLTAEENAPTRAHPNSPHTGPTGRLAHRMWRLADTAGQCRGARRSPGTASIPSATRRCPTTCAAPRSRTRRPSRASPRHARRSRSSALPANTIAVAKI